MFYTLTVTLCLAVLFLLFAGTTAFSVLAERILFRKLPQRSPSLAANLLFAVRLFPFALAVISTFGLVLPAFLMFEPRATEEGLELHLIILAFFGVAIVALTLVRGWQVLRATRCLEREWLRDAKRIFPHGVNVPVYRVENEKSLIAVTGVFHARIFVARGVAENLSCEELQAALAHEMAHAAVYDNLKQLLLKMTRLPRWLKSQKADIEWVNASELSADQQALSGGVSPMDLSSALIKVGRLSRPVAIKETIASHFVPPAHRSSLELRITKLSELLEGKQDIPARTFKQRQFWLPIALAFLAYATCIKTMLPAVHAALELLVR